MDGGGMMMDDFAFKSADVDKNDCYLDFDDDFDKDNLE